MTDKIEFEENDNDKSDTCLAEILLINKIIKAEQRIADGESYMEMSKLKKELGI